MSYLSKLKNLFCKDEDFFDKEATIKEYFALVPSEDRKHVSTYDELYEEALRYVSKQNFAENTKNQDDYFHILSNDEGMIAVFVGILSYGIAREVDKKGTDIEKAIDKMLPKDYDVNNPFDVKKGYGHRIFGHDPATFGLRNIPGDMLIHVKDEITGKDKVIRIGDFLGKDISKNVSMWDLIWKFYGNNSKPMQGIFNSLGHIIAHFTKDLFTPAGLPVSFVSLFTEYQKYMNEGRSVSTVEYKDSLMYKLDKQKMNMKSSDFAAYLFIKSFTHFYCVQLSKNKAISDVDGFKRDVQLLAMGTCISMQMATIVMGNDLQVGKKGNKPMIPGGKVNLLMTGVFFKEAMADILSIENARREINKKYKSNYMEGL